MYKILTAAGLAIMLNRSLIIAEHGYGSYKFLTMVRALCIGMPNLVFLSNFSQLRMLGNCVMLATSMPLSLALEFPVYFHCSEQFRLYA